MVLVLWIGVAVVAVFHPVLVAIGIMAAIIFGGLKL